LKKFGGVIVIVIIIEQIWCNWSNSAVCQPTVSIPQTNVITFFRL